MISNLFSTRQVLSAHFRTAFTIDTRRDDAASISGTFATGEKSLEANMHQGFCIADDADRTAGARLHTYHDRFVGQEAVTLAAKSLEAFLQTVANGLGQPEMQW